MIVGTVEILAIPIATGFEDSLKKQTGPAFAGVAADAEIAGADAGAKLDSGVKRGSSGLVGTVSKLGEGIVAGLVGAGVAAVDLASKYQSSTATIAANADISVKAAQKISDAFLGTMGKTIYSAQTIATSYGAVAGQLGAVEGHALKAGEATKVMSAAMDLAEASGSKLESTTADLASVMQAYHQQVGQAASDSDILFNASRVTGVGIDELTSSLDKMKSKLGSTAPSLGESASLLATLAKNGVTGRAAMSALSSGFTTLLGGGKPATEMAKELGVQIFNASGKFVGLQSIITQLRPKLSEYTEQSQLQATKALFGATANKQLLDVILQGPAAFKQETDAVTKSGSAKEAAAKQAQTFGHQVDLLKATAVDLGIKFGSILLPKLVEVGKALSEGVTWLTKHKAAAEALAYTIASVLGLAVAVFAEQKAVAFSKSVGNMISDMSKLVSAITTGTAKIVAQFTAQDTAAATAATGVEGSVGAEATAVTTADTTIESENVAAGASFTALLGPIAAVAAAAGAAYLIVKKLEGAGITEKGQSPAEQAKIEAESAARLGTGKDSSYSSAANPAVTQYSKIAEEAAAKYGLPASLLLSDIENESKGDPLAKSDKGAGGLTQFIPETAAAYGVKYGNTLEDIRSQIMGQAHYLQSLGASSNARLALEKYNGLPGSLESTSYAAKVLAEQHLYESHASGDLGIPLGGAGSSKAGGGHTTGSKTLLSPEASKAAEAAAKKMEEATTKAEKERAEAAVKAAKKDETDSAAGSKELNRLLEAIHSKSLTSLNTALNLTHTAALNKVEKDLDADHKTALSKMSADLVKTQKTAMEEAGKLMAAATKTALEKKLASELGQKTTEIGEISTLAATKIADETKIGLDQEAEGGLSGAGLTAAQAQTHVDQVTLATDEAIGAAKLAEDKATSELGKAQAANALAGVEAGGRVSAAEAQRALEFAKAQASSAASAATASEAAKTAIATVAAATATQPPIEVNVYGDVSASDLTTEIGWALKIGTIPAATALPG